MTTVAQRKTSIFSRVLEESVTVVLAELEGGLADPSQKHPSGQNLMFFAAARQRRLGGAEAVARRLRMLGVKADCFDRLRQTALYYAAREGNARCGEFLVEQNCDVNHLDINRQTPLFYAVRGGRIEMCRVLQKLGASLDVADMAGRTPASFASAETMVALAGNGVSLGRIASPDVGGRKVVVLPSLPEKPPPAPAPVETRWVSEQLPTTPATTASSHNSLDPSHSDGPDDASSTTSDAAADVEQVRAVNTKKRRRLQLSPVPPPIQVTEAASSSIDRWARPGPARMAPTSSPVSEEAFAHVGNAVAGHYLVCRPAAADAPPLRELEREFVADHYHLFCKESWTDSTTIADWCAVVNVIEAEATALHAIRRILTSASPNQHVTLQCVFVPGTPDGQSEIVGYVHFVVMRTYLDVSHLKVSNCHRRRGLGALLLAGMVRYAEHVGSRSATSDLRLVAMSRNENALQLYSALGFKPGEVVSKKVRGGLAKIDWTKMVCSGSRAQQSVLIKQFLERCYNRSSRSLR